MSLETQKICRLCLAAPKKLAYQSIFVANNLQPNQPSLAMQIVSVVSLEVFENDGMPKTICYLCKLLIENTYKFKQFCKKSDVLLKTFEITGVVPSPQPLPKELKTMVNEPVVTKHVACQTNPVRFATKPKELASAGCQTDQEYQLEYLEEPEEEEEQFFIEVEQVKPATASKTSKPEADIKSETVKILNKIPSTQRPIIAKASYGNAPKQKILNNSKLLNKVYKEDFLDNPTIHQNENGNMEIITADDEITEFKVIVKGEDSNRTTSTATSTQSNVFACPHCERSFPLKQQLVIHQENHVRERNFPCSTCDRAFFSKYDLGKHVMTHTGEKKFQCVICSKSFSRSTLLYRHEKIHVDCEKFECTSCERFYLDPTALEKHMNTHQKNRPFSCSICDKKFAFKQGLERHEIVHASDQPYKCQYCSLSYPSAGKLARHLVVHAGERPFPCKLCPKQFLLSHHLSRHLRSHQPHLVSTFQCSYCPESFENKNDYYDHAAQHATDSLSCPLCKMEFEDIDEVLEHIKEHTVNDSHSCDYCDLMFIQEDQLEMHCIKSHAKELCTVNDYTLQEGDEILEEFVIEPMEIKPVALKRKNAVVHNIEIIKKSKNKEVKEDVDWDDEKEKVETTVKKAAFTTPAQVKNEVNKKLSVDQKPIPSLKTLPQVSKKSQLSTPIAVQTKTSPITRKSLSNQKAQEVITKLPKGLTVKNTSKSEEPSKIKLGKLTLGSPQPSTSATKSQTPVKPCKAITPKTEKSPQVAIKTTPLKPSSKQKIERVKMTREEIDRLKAEGKIEYDASGNMILKK